MSMKHIACDCEHESHFFESHRYGQEFDAAEVEVVKTIYGTYHFCKACQAQHPLPKELLSDH